jgi:CheY-like chemotaxis protein
MIVKSTLPHIRDMLSRARKNALRLGVSVGALLIALIHIWKPHLQIDSITMVLLVISVLPWVQSLIRSIELPGGVRLELRELRELAKGASQDATLALTAAGAIGHLGGKRALWVDDEPQNNTHGINALQAQGINVVVCKTTQEALEQVHKGKFDVIITDQLRYEDGIRKDRAGYDLIGRLQQDGVKVPVILSTAYPNREEAHNLGFYDAAANQQDVFKLAIKAIQGA